MTRRPLSFVACTALLALAGCEKHAIDLEKPSAAELAAALSQVRQIAPAAKTGRWEVAVSPPDAKLEGMNEEDAAALRDWGKAINTTTRCRTHAQALDPLTEIAIKVDIRDGCAVERFTADPDRLSYTSRCMIGRTAIRRETNIRFAPDRFVTVRKTVVDHGNDGDADESRSLQYDGRHVGECRGDESPQQALWSDPG